ncbi:odorant receptor 49a [Halyomorpha halys]|uniref:odorant receptor 49a n=1 Tax=Halyomorpha halys TaxID=286706 RepID=UPI0034D2351A
MWQYREDPEANRLVDAYILKHYYYLLEISGLYHRMDGRTRIFSISQLIIYFFTLSFHLILIIKSTIPIYGLNKVLFSQNVHFALLMLMSIIALLSSMWNNLKKFLIHRLLSNDFYDYQEPAVIGEDILRSNAKTQLRRLTLVPITAALAAGTVLSVSPIVDFKAGTFDFNRTASMLDYHLLYPYGKFPYSVKDGFGYYSAMLGQLACGFLMAVVIGGGGFLFINVSESVILQMKILNNSLDNIESRIDHLYSKLFGKMNSNCMKSLRRDSLYTYCYSECLRKNFEHHQVILKAFNLIKEISSIPIGSAYLTGTIVIALSFISAGSAKELPGTTVGSMLLCAGEISYMFLFSLSGQRIIDLSTELRYKMYNTRWYICSEEIKKSFMIFQEITLKPMTMMVAKVVPANMETFTAVGLLLSLSPIYVGE